MKKCLICNLEKSFDCFYLDIRYKSEVRYRCLCKQCYSLKSKEIRKKYIDKRKKQANKYYAENKNKKRKYALENKEKIEKYRKEYCLKNKEKIAANRKLYYEKNKEYFKNYNAEYNKKNREKLNKKTKNRRANGVSLNYKISERIRIRIRSTLKCALRKKDVQTNELLGCTYNQLIVYLESKFTKGMTWENYGKSGWHIDHIKPCASFDLTIKEEQKKCFHYTNLQPLWATRKIAIKHGESYNYVGNLEKGDKLFDNI